ncbi:MAG: DUF748 domain-containing protein, partial [Deltaproteobacteria bacterium]|nr:DUF748 domain-containing protein [Deltaproteobacteria bacterium]
MLRFLSERRVWVVAAFVTFALVLGLRSWAASEVPARAADLIEERLGVEAQIEEARWSFGGVELRGVELSGRHGGLVARIERVEARMSLFGAVFKGARSVRALSAQGLEVILDLSHEGFPDSIAELKTSSPRPDPASASSSNLGKGRTYALDGVTVRVVDADGRLASINDLSLRKDGDDMSGGIGDALLGEQSADHATIGPSKGKLRRSEGAWKLRELDIQGASVRSLRNGNEETRALAARLRDAMSQLRGSPSDTETETATGIEIGNETETGNAPLRPVAPPTGARLFARLTPDAVVDVTGVQIESRTSAGHVERIRDFGWSLNGAGNGWYRVVVGGQTSNDGTLKVDLSVMPREARAEGSIELRRISLAVVAPFVPEVPFYDDEIGTLSAELQLAASSPEQISIEGRLRVRRLALNSERIAAEPVDNINMDIKGKGSWYPGDRRLKVERGEVRMGKVGVLIDGELERSSEHYRVDLTAKLPPTPCNDVVAAIPEDVLGSLARFAWSGSWSVLAHVSLDSRELEAAELSIRVRNLCQFEKTPRWVRVERFQAPFRH